MPTFKIADDGTVDWSTFSGFRRYHSDCHVCHGPDGEGSTYAPALKNSAMRMDYYDFVDVVASGRAKVGAAENQVMPGFGTNPNVMCYLDDIWIYLRARGADAIPRGRPAKRADKPDGLRRGREGLHGRLRMRWAGARAARRCRPAAAPAAAQVADLVDRTAFRVCADPANLPLSDEDGRGSRTRSPSSSPRRLGRPLQYTWFPKVTGFVRQTLQAGKCDVIMGYAQGDEMVLNTNHYYTSTHVLVVRADGDLADVDTLADPRLQGRKIGVIAGAPPATHVARLGLMTDAEPYKLMVDRRVEDPAGEMLADLEAGRIDAALLWGPIGGPLVKQGHPRAGGDAAAARSRGRRGSSSASPWGCGPGEDDWKRELNSQIRAQQAEIDAILRDCGRADPRRLRQGGEAGRRAEARGLARCVLRKYESRRSSDCDL